MDCGQEFIKNVRSLYFHAGSVDAGVTADGVTFQNVFVYKELYMMIMVIHQPHDTDRTRQDVQRFEHLLRGSEGEPCRADLGRELTCLKRFVTGDHQQIECSLLAVTQKQIFADRAV